MNENKEYSQVLQEVLRGMSDKNQPGNRQVWNRFVSRSAAGPGEGLTWASAIVFTPNNPILITDVCVCCLMIPTAGTESQVATRFQIGMIAPGIANPELDNQVDGLIPAFDPNTLWFGFGKSDTNPKPASLFCPAGVDISMSARAYAQFAAGDSVSWFVQLGYFQFKSNF